MYRKCHGRREQSWGPSPCLSPDAPSRRTRRGELGPNCSLPPNLHNARPMPKTAVNTGLLIVLCGPSGVGKSTISRQLEEKLNICYTVSATTRVKQPGDDEGKTYDHIDRQEFF